MNNQVAQVSEKERAAVEPMVPAGYKQTEVGVIPEDWDALTIDDIAIFSGGSQPPRSTFINIPQAGYIRLIQIRDYKTSDFETYIPIQLARKFCSRHDIMIGRYGPPIFQILRGIEGAYNVALIKATPKPCVYREYLYYFLSSDKLFDFIDKLSQRSSGQTGVELPALKAYPVPLPPVEEQIIIANALSDVDALLGSLDALIAKKQAIKTATMQQLLTGRTRLPQFANHPDGSSKGYKTSELGEIPEDWEINVMGEVGYTFGGLSGKNKDDFGHGNSYYIPFTNVMANVVVDLEALEVVDVQEPQNEVKYGDLLFNGSSETPEEVCFCSLVNKETTHLYLNSFCFGFRFKDLSLFFPLYLSYWFRSDVGRGAVSVMAQGSTRYNISKSQFLKFSIALPCLNEQTAIATILSDMDEEIQALEQRLAKTRDLKQGMMQQLLTGKTRLI